MLEFIACQPDAESATHLIFNGQDESGHRDRIVRAVAEPLGHVIAHEGWGESVAPDGHVFVGDVVSVEPPLGLSTLIAISSNLSASMGIANGYFENSLR